MNNTYQILLLWDKGQAFSERLAAKILGLEGYSEIDPQSPRGGPDGRKDILCIKDVRRLVVGVYFPGTLKDFSDVASKYRHDYEGVAINDADGFVFVTNQKLTTTERLKLATEFPGSEIYHGERVTNLLDSPRGYGIRFEYLGIELTREEQIAYMDSHLDLERRLVELQSSIDSVRAITSRIEGFAETRDLLHGGDVFALPTAGVLFTSRLSVEDVFAIHAACTYDQAGVSSGCYRNVEVWIGAPGGAKKDALYIPPPAAQVPRLMSELIGWWREEYQIVCHAENRARVIAIAEFHNRLLSIHPFLDGNGRVARVLSTLQFRDLLKKEIRFDEIPNEGLYYRALREGQAGDHRRLADVLLSLS